MPGWTCGSYGRAASVAVAVAVAIGGAAGCGASTLPGERPDLGGSAGDLAASADLGALDGAGGSPDLRPPGDLGGGGPDLAGFCGDPTSPRIELNKMLALTPVVSAHPIFLDCCDGAELSGVSMQIATPIVVAWRHQVGQGPSPPVTLDLAKLPPGWSVTVLSGCASSQSGCQPSDTYTSGLVGTLSVAGNPGSYQMSVCLGASETMAAPHPVIHSLRFWSPTITTQ